MKSLAIATLLFASQAALLTSSHAATAITKWTFETSIPTTGGPHAAEFGTGSATGVHASGSTVFSNPSGNGSVESFSSNFWGVGDYYQFTLATTGFEDITISWDQTGSNTGPRDFELQYQIGAGAFTNVLSFSLTNDGWGPTPNGLSTRTFDFSAISGLDNAASVTFRLTDRSTTAITGGTVATGATGRVDNFTISGTAVPEPSTGLLGLIAAACLPLRRRRK